MGSRKTESRNYLSTQQIIIDKELLEEETMDDIACRMPIQSVADGPGRDPLEGTRAMQRLSEAHTPLVKPKIMDLL